MEIWAMFWADKTGMDDSGRLRIEGAGLEELWIPDADEREGITFQLVLLWRGRRDQEECTFRLRFLREDGTQMATEQSIDLTGIKSRSGHVSLGIPATCATPDLGRMRAEGMIVGEGTGTAWMEYDVVEGP